MRLLLMIGLCLTVLHASFTAGKTIYANQCKQCHLSLKSLAIQKHSNLWKDLFKNQGKHLSDIHLKRQDAKNSWPYFESTSYKEHSNDIKDAFVKYASDKSRHTSCH